MMRSCASPITFEDGAEAPDVQNPKKSHILYQLVNAPQSDQQLASVKLRLLTGLFAKLCVSLMVRGIKDHR